MKKDVLIRYDLTKLLRKSDSNENKDANVYKKMLLILN